MIPVQERSHDSTKEDDKHDRKKDQDDEKDDDRKKDDKDDKDDRKKGDKKEKHKKKKDKKKDDGKNSDSSPSTPRPVTKDNRKKEKPKKGEVPQARGTMKKKGLSFCERLTANVKKHQKDLFRLQEERKVKEKKIEAVNEQIHLLESDAQTRVRALQLSRTDWLAEIEERAGAVEKKRKDLLGARKLAVQYEAEHQSVSESPCSKSSSSSEYSSYYSASEEEEVMKTNDEGR